MFKKILSLVQKKKKSKSIATEDCEMCRIDPQTIAALKGEKTADKKEKS